MRTKTIILSAACGLLAAAAANADSVYSVNVVGYVNNSFPANTWKIIGNPLKTANNYLSEVFSSMTDADGGTTLYIWDASTSKYTSYIYYGVTDGWANLNTDADANSVVFAPGVGAWIIFVNAAKTVTYVGDVSQGTLSESILAGWNQVASIVPQASDIISLGLTNPTAGDYFYKYTTSTSKPWQSSIYIPDDGGWEDLTTGELGTPTLDVGEGAWYYALAPITWTRTFSVE
jgi:hypothetical protein